MDDQEREPMRTRSTRELADELASREGVDVETIPYGESRSLSIDGPAIVLTVVD